MAEERNFRKVRRGYVVSDKMDKTISVELEQRSTHPLYGKVVRSTRTVKVHDEHNEAHIGDLVSIMAVSYTHLDVYKRQIWAR